MNRAYSFDFVDRPSLSAEAFVVRIPAGIVTSEALLRSFYEEARLPGYFGFNWDALSDCLRDLHWIDCYEVIVLHADIPQLPARELRTYLDVLAECAASWMPGEAHSLKITFPAAARAQIEKVE